MDINDYRTIYNVAECAGLDTTATYLSETEAQKIADWINGDETLSGMFYAYTVNSSGSYYSTIIVSRAVYNVNENSDYADGIGIGYYSSGYPRTILYKYHQGTSVQKTDGITTTTTLLNLRFVTYKSDYGYAAAFYAYGSSPEVRFVCTTAGTDDGTKTDVPISLVYPASTPVYWSDGNYYGNYGKYLTNVNTSYGNTRTDTILQRLYLHNSDYVLDNVRLGIGKAWASGEVFADENGGWLSLAYSSSSPEFLALRLWGGVINRLHLIINRLHNCITALCRPINIVKGAA